MNRHEVLIQIEDLMLDVCLDRYYWQSVMAALEDYREAATAIYDPELEYSPMLQGYFDLMSISSKSSSGRAINPRRSPLQSRTAFQNFCNGLMDEHDHFILKHKRQRKRNFTAIKNHIEYLLDDGHELLLMLEGVSYPYTTAQDIYQFHENLKKFHRRVLNRDTCFKELLDYSWVIEQDRDEGYLCQFLFIYDGSYRNHTEKYVEEIIQILDDSEEENDSLNRESKHQHRDSYEQDTLKSDMIHCNDVQIEENNLNIISILANFDIEDQYLRARVKGMRCFG